MAKKNGQNEADRVTDEIAARTQAAFDEASNRGRDVSEKWARGMEDGTELIGVYLGYDWVDTRYGRPKRRHIFAEAVARDVNGTPIVPDGNGGMVIFGMSSLDNTLREVELGSRVHITRLGTTPDSRRVKFACRVLAGGAATRDMIVGRPDMPGRGAQPADWRQ